MTEKVKKIKEFVEKEGYDGIQTFFTRNIVGDHMVTIYEDEDVTIDFCEGWYYLEIFGLTEEEQKELLENTELDQ